jgi:class 3 adenylate cyclase/tetratricopeptide (TPR) repeat protein
LATLKEVCGRCGTASPEGFRFCGGCGALLLATPEQRQARKVVTVLFCDVAGSTALGEELDPEVLRGVMNRYFAEMRASIERHGGTVEKFIGDAVMAVFGIPTIHEDDALRAVRAAAEIRDRLPAVATEVGVELRFRTGVNTGPVVIGEGQTLATGDAVNVAARLEQAARPGEIVLGPETFRLVRHAVDVKPLAPLELKGKSEPVAAVRLIRVDPVAASLARRIDSSLVGRERELGTLRRTWERVIEDARCHWLTILGGAGVGKTRLAAEFLSEVDGVATVLRGRCLHYGEGITFAPLVEALKAGGDPAAPTLERLVSGAAAAPEELFWDVRRLLESLARKRPVVLQIDDVHWAEPMLVDLIVHVAELSRDAPILLLCTERLESLEDRSRWWADKPQVTTVPLEPLDRDQSENLLEQLGEGLDPETRARLIAASDGNPLILEELVALARERGTVAMPSTVQALLAARLDRLAPEERELLECAAIEGEVFHRRGVRALMDERVATDFGAVLAALVRKQFIRSHQATLGGDEAFRFRHQLLRDVAYDAMSKTSRAELHARFAHWLELNAPDLVELDEVAGWNLEQTVRYETELGRPLNAELAQGASEHLHVAGQRAAGRSDMAAATNLLERAYALAPSDCAIHAEIAVTLAEHLIDGGDLARVDALLSAVEHDPAVAQLAALVRLEWVIQARPKEAVGEISSKLPAVLARLTSTGEERGLAKAHMIAFWGHWLAKQATLAAEDARRAAEHAQAVGDKAFRARALGWYIAALMYGRQHADVITRELDAIEREHPGPYLMAFVDQGRGLVAELAGRFDEARERMLRAIDGGDAMGMHALAAVGRQVLARVELSRGDPAAAREQLILSDAPLAQLGAHAFRSTSQAYLALVNERLGDRDGAQAAIELAEQLGAAEDAINRVITDRVRARFALVEGRPVEAERWARSGVEQAFMTDHVVIQGKAKLGLAQVLATLGKPDEALLELRDALELFESKGDQPGASMARAILGQSSGTSPSPTHTGAGRF